jgi:hypothetical protein
MKLKALLASVALTACGQAPVNSQAHSQSDSQNQKTLCQAFAELEEPVAATIMNPAQVQPSANELSMIQTTVLLSHVEAVTPSQALDIFTDKENGGSLGGDISYFKIKQGNRTKTLAKVVYYPGDNEYGAIFEVWTFENGNQSSGLIGKIGDSDLYCLEYVKTY